MNRHMRRSATVRSADWKKAKTQHEFVERMINAGPDLSLSPPDQFAESQGRLDATVEIAMKEMCNSAKKGNQAEADRWQALIYEAGKKRQEFIERFSRSMFAKYGKPDANGEMRVSSVDAARMMGIEHDDLKENVEKLIEEDPRTFRDFVG